MIQKEDKVGLIYRTAGEKDFNIHANAKKVLENVFAPDTHVDLKYTNGDKEHLISWISSPNLTGSTLYYIDYSKMDLIGFHKESPKEVVDEVLKRNRNLFVLNPLERMFSHGINFYLWNVGIPIKFMRHKLVTYTPYESRED